MGHCDREKAFLEVVQLLPIEIYSNSASAESMGTWKMEILHHLLKIYSINAKPTNSKLPVKLFTGVSELIPAS